MTNDRDKQAAEAVNEKVARWLIYYQAVNGQGDLVWVHNDKPLSRGYGTKHCPSMLTADSMVMILKKLAGMAGIERQGGVGVYVGVMLIKLSYEPHEKKPGVWFLQFRYKDRWFCGDGETKQEAVLNASYELLEWLEKPKGTE